MNFIFCRRTLCPRRYNNYHGTLAEGVRQLLKRSDAHGSSYLIGGRSHSVLTRNLGAVRLAGAKLDSRLLRAVIGIPLNEFRDSTLTLSEINARPLLDLDESVQGMHSPEYIKAELDRIFMGSWRRAARRPHGRRAVGTDSTQSRHPSHHEVVAC
jgi:hypothetical protein